MFETALRYPWDDGDGAMTIAIGGILSVLTFLLVPIVLLAGYTLRVLAAVAEDEEAPLPAWEDWAGLFVDGLKAIAVSLVYGVGPVLLVVLSVLAILVPVTTQVSQVVSLVFVGLALLSLPLTLLGIYLLPAALVRVATTGRVGAGFAVRSVWRTATTGTYVTGWLYGVGITLAAGVLSSLLAATVIGGVLTPFLTFYAGVSAAYCYARGTTMSKGVETQPEEGLDEQVA